MTEVWNSDRHLQNRLITHTADEHGRNIFSDCKWLAQLVDEVGGRFISTQNEPTWLIKEEQERQVASKVIEKLRRGNLELQIS